MPRMISRVASSIPASRPFWKYDRAEDQVAPNSRMSSTMMTARIPIRTTPSKANPTGLNINRRRSAFPMKSAAFYFRRGAFPRPQSITVCGYPLVSFAPRKIAGSAGRRMASALMGRHPGPGFALRGGDLDLGHQLGDLAAEPNGVSAAFQGCEVEPLMGRDEIDDAGTSARPVQTTFEQHVGDRARFHRYCRILIDVPLKHPPLLFVVFAAPCPSAA